ncbi:MAG: type IV toxin-antitoxin system AbiEi family antitoxin domain-containing protein [Actinobacteria bacterium]|nr:type IV toxin-antitoxin system AbiEi family antitoxin domain-containing protein [Actinomycetota bacterium]
MDQIRLLAESRGFFTRAEALDSGNKDRDLVAGVRSRTLVRFRHGYYTFDDLWSSLDATAQHLVRARAVQNALGPTVVLSHTSAAIVHGIAVWGADLGRVHVTRLDRGAGRVEADVVHHVGAVGTDIIETVDGLRCFAADRSVVEAASWASSEQALVLFDSFLHLGLGEHRDLRKRFEAMCWWPRMRHLHLPIRMADAGADGPGESRGRWLFRASALPAPVLQYEVQRADGTVAGVSDWAWPDPGLLGEFDGRLKYGRLLRPGESAADAVFREKRREDELREITGWPMFRLTWSDYEHPVPTAARVARLLRRAA